MHTGVWRLTRLALALDDEKVWRDAVNDAAVGLNLTVEGFPDFEDFRARFVRVNADLVVLDWNMPGKNGLAVLEWIRASWHPAVPVIMLTSRENDDDIVAVLEAGADDYVTKPCSIPVLAARMKTLLGRGRAAGSTNDRLQCADVLLNRATGTATRSMPTDPLTEREFTLAWALFQSLDTPISRETLYLRVWGQSEKVNSRSLDTHIGSSHNANHTRRWASHLNPPRRSASFFA